MKYQLHYGEDVYNDLHDAIAFCLEYHMDRGPRYLLELADNAFESALLHPHAAPTRRLPGELILYRRVIVWHFVFLYRIDEEAKLLIVDRIFHERSDV